jgi:penicillin-binding protein A
MNMNVSIGRLTYAFIGLFLLISLVVVNIQVFQASSLAASSYNPRHCISTEEPLRGTIYDRHGIWLVKSVLDDKALCGYRRVWNKDAVNAGLAPLIGYFSYRYGATGIEAQYNDVLSGITGVPQCSVIDAQCIAAQSQQTYNRLLHKQVRGSDIYLTIDLKLQEQVNALYNQDALFGGVCQAPGSDPPGAVIVEAPNTGEVLAMLSRPYYDPNRLDDDAYWHQITTDPNSPLLNRAAQSRYAPGSTFKTVTLAAGLNEGQFALDTPFTKNDALYYHVPNGETVTWYDYFPSAGSNGWVGIPFPVTVQDGYAYSDNVIFAHMAVQLGADTWLSYLRHFGIATPGTDVAPVPFDSAYIQSRAFNPGADFNNDLLADSGYGQGQLFITPLTMAEITSTMAAEGQLWIPHILFATAVPGQQLSDATAQSPQLYTGRAVLRPETAAAVRKAMRAVVEYGTVYHTSSELANSPAQEGGKTGTAQTPGSQSVAGQTWWISMAPASSGSPGKLAIVVMKEHSGEGACQIFVADDIYKCAAVDQVVDLGDLGPCPARP